jgi:hypothetical protein
MDLAVVSFGFSFASLHTDQNFRLIETIYELYICRALFLDDNFDVTCRFVKNDLFSHHIRASW